MIWKSEVESKRFGLNVYRVTLCRITSETLDYFYRELKNADVVILRVPLSEIQNLTILRGVKNAEMFMADVQIYFNRQIEPLEQFDLLPNTSISFREGTKRDHPQIEAVIRESFSDYRSHYDANPLFDKKDIIDGYVEFALTNVNEFERNSRCIVAVNENDDIVGFSAFGYSQEEKTLNNGLIGISKKKRNLGIYRNLLRFKFNFASSIGAANLTVCTRADNYSVIRNWIRDGYLFNRTEITVHLNRKHS